VCSAVFSLAQAPDVSAGSGFYILPFQRGDFAIAEAGLNGKQQERSILLSSWRLAGARRPRSSLIAYAAQHRQLEARQDGLGPTLTSPLRRPSHVRCHNFWFSLKGPEGNAADAKSLRTVSPAVLQRLALRSSSVIDVTVSRDKMFTQTQGAN
jgi:hypothetical protein